MKTTRRKNKAAADEFGADPRMWGTGGAKVTDATRGRWFKEARFAMFIHWGLYSQLAGVWRGKPRHIIGEWIQHHARISAKEYAKTARVFDPVHFDPRQIVQLAKDAGMRYIVITAKHHDGFAMYKSAASPFNIVDATPSGRDAIAALAAACREADMPLGFYYSQTQDWHEPDAVGNTWDAFGGHKKDFARYLAAKAIPQIEELLTNYGPVSLIWFDTPGPIESGHSRTLMDRIRRLQPACLVNSRIGNGLGDYETLGDQEFPRLARGGLWETIDTHNDTWGFVAHDHNWKSPREIVQRLVRIVSRGGNYMLNIGPDGKGRVPQASARILRQVGRWLKVHGPAIYGAEPSPLGPVPWGECTARDGKLYLHVFQWPAGGRLVVPRLGRAAKAARIMGGRKLKTRRAGEHLEILVGSLPPKALAPVVELDVRGRVRAWKDAYVLNDCVSTLVAPAAVGKGFRQVKRSWMEKFGDWKHMECLAGWTGPAAAALWDFVTIEAGSFYVDVEYACEPGADYGQWHMKLGRCDVPFPLLSSGDGALAPGRDLARFRTCRVGLFDLPAGRHTLSLSPAAKPLAAVHISAITFTPAE